MRILLKFVLDCEPDAAWRAIRSPVVFAAVSSPFTTFKSLEPEGFPETWPEGPHQIEGRAFGILPAGRQFIDLSFEERDGVRLMHDSGGGVSGPLALITRWHHTMAIAAAPGGRTLYRDQLVFGAGALTLAVWPALWAFWQWRGLRLRSLAQGWRA